MASPTAMAVASLRDLNYRLSSTPTKQLPKVAPQIAGAIWNCRDLLSTPTDNKQNSDVSVIVHRFKTHLSTLLSDRSIEGRWSAVVLVKATVEAGGLEILSKCNAWVRSLLGILKKPDPPTTRSLVVLTLTRIFMLTWDYSNLVREITTPALTAFVPTCLSNIENKRCSSRELETVLEAFVTLLPRHPTIFRTNEARLRTYLTNILSADLESTVHFTASHRDAAGRLLALLHTVAPKQGANEKWDETFKSVTTAAHATCDRIFRAVYEDWESVAGVTSSVRPRTMGGDVESESHDVAGLNPWKGVYAGSERIVTLLGLIKSHLVTSTSGPVSLRFGIVADLLTRVFAIALPHAGNKEFMKMNKEVSKDEREALFAVLPSIHVAAMDVCAAVLDRFESNIVAWVQSLAEQVVSVYKAEYNNVELRIATYQLMSKAIDIIGPTMSKGQVAEIASVLKSCCDDLLHDDGQAAPTKTGNGIKQQLGMADSKVVQSYPTETPILRESASNLLRTALDRLAATTFPPKLRAQIDRTAVLSRNQDILFSSVMNPARKANDSRVQSSLLPITARQFGQDNQVEALLRPRMPPIQTGSKEAAIEDEEDEEDDEVEEIIDEDKMAVEGEQEQLDAQLQANGKRRADEEAEATTTAKRLRASPVAESLLPETVQTLPGPDLVVAQSDTPTAVALPRTGNDIVTATLPSNAQQPGASVSAVENAAPNTIEDYDDSDTEEVQVTAELSSDDE